MKLRELWLRVWARVEPYSKYAPIVGYPLFYVLCLCVFASLTFPYDKLKDRLVASFNAEQRAANSQRELQIERMSGYGLSGVRMSGVTVLSPPPEPGKPATKLLLDEVSLRYELLPLMVGDSDVDFGIYAFDGSARGEYAAHGKEKSLDVTVDSFDIGKIGPLVSFLGVPLQGRLGGMLRLSMGDGTPSKAAGELSFESKGTAVGDGVAKLKGALALPKIEVGTLTLAGEAKDGVLKVTKLVAAGKDVEVQGDGRITLRDNVADSICDLTLRFRINDVYRNKNDVTKSLFGAPGSAGPALFELADPKIKQSKRADGYYSWSVRGALAHADFIPSAR